MQGHELVHSTNGVTCTKCHVTRGHQLDWYFVNHRCQQAQPNNDKLKRMLENHTIDKRFGEARVVSLNRANKERRMQRNQLREIQQDIRQNITACKRKAMDTYIEECRQHKVLQTAQQHENQSKYSRLQGTVGPTDDPLSADANDCVNVQVGTNTFTIHTSHKTVVVCGGYVACENCLRYTYLPRKAAKFKEVCRGRDNTPNFQHRQELNNLRQGKLPHEHNSRRRANPLTWPSGEGKPTPKVVHLQVRGQ